MCIIPSLGEDSLETARDGVEGDVDARHGCCGRGAVVGGVLGGCRSWEEEKVISLLCACDSTRLQQRAVVAVDGRKQDEARRKEEGATAVELTEAERATVVGTLRRVVAAGRGQKEEAEGVGDFGCGARETEPDLRQGWLLKLSIHAGQG